ncbi:unnamed protein product, partial [Sphenostylis stenocarpa]
FLGRMADSDVAVTSDHSENGTNVKDDDKKAKHDNNFVKTGKRVFGPVKAEALPRTCFDNCFPGLA